MIIIGILGTGITSSAGSSTNSLPVGGAEGGGQVNLYIHIFEMLTYKPI
jgi:hypothetical protein